MSEGREGRNLKRRAAMKKWKAVLAVFLSVVLVLQSSNIQALADVIVGDGESGREEIVLDKPAEETEPSEPVDEQKDTPPASEPKKEEPAEPAEPATPEEPAEKKDEPAEKTESVEKAEETKPAEETEPAQTTEPSKETSGTTADKPSSPETEDTTATLKFDVTGATLTYNQDGEKNVTADTADKTAKVETTQDFKFTVTPDDGQQIASVKAVASDGAESDVAANDSGEYTLAAANVTDGTTIKVTTEAVAEPETPAEEETTETDTTVTDDTTVEDEETAPETTLNSVQSVDNSISLMADRAAGENSWAPQWVSDFIMFGHYEGTLTIGNHRYTDGSLIGEETSVRLNEDGTDSVTASSLALKGYELESVKYGNQDVYSFRINSDGDLQYKTSRNSRNWNDVRNVGNITFTYVKRGDYTVKWYVNGQLVETDWVNRGAKPDFNQGTPTRLGVDEARFEGWATAAESHTWSAESELPAVTGNVSYYAIFTTHTYFYFLLPEDGKYSTSSAPEDYMYAGDGRAIVPDGMSAGNRRYAPTYNIEDYITERPTDEEIRKGLATYYDGRYGRDKYESTWTYTINWTTVTVANNSVGYDYGYLHYGSDLHIDTTIQVDTTKKSTVTYTVANADGSNESRNRQHPNDSVIAINSTVNTSAQQFTTDGYTVTKATITVTAGDQTKVEGERDPQLTTTYSGAKNGETPGWTGSAAREDGEKPGDYKIMQGTLALADNPDGKFKADNYDLEFIPGTLTITAADDGDDDTPVTPVDPVDPGDDDDNPGGGGDDTNPGGGGTTTGGRTNPVPVAVTAGDDTDDADDAEDEGAVEEDETPLTDGTESDSEQIGDDTTPLASGETNEQTCWTHWVMLAGLGVTVVYFALSAARTRRATNELASFEDDVLGGR